VKVLIASYGNNLQTIYFILLSRM